MAKQNKQEPKKQVEKNNAGPEKRFQRGNCIASVFANKVQKDNKDIIVRNVVPQKIYRDQNGQWQATNSFGTNDLPRIILAMQEAYKYLTPQGE